MNERTDSDVLMPGVVAAIGQQLLTETETMEPELAPTPTFGLKKVFSVMELKARGWAKAAIRKLKLIELRNTWIGLKAGFAARMQSAAAASSTEEEKLQEYVDFVEIVLPKLTAEELASRAITHFNDFVADTEKHKAFNGSAQEFLRRISVNYVRHELAEYAEHFPEIVEAPIYLCELYDGIGRMYPHLHDECRRQNNERAIRERQVQMK